jgi:hypothetical protein
MARLESEEDDREVPRYETISNSGTDRLLAR